MATTKYQCLICSATFSQKADLKVHEDSIHKRIKFDCQDCGKQLANKKNLIQHINSVHRGIKYKCNLCNKEFREGFKKNKKKMV